MTPPPRSLDAAPDRVLRGMALMVAAVALLTIMDAFVKTLTQMMSVPQAMFFRCLLALPVLMALAPLDGGWARLLAVDWRLQGVRALVATVTGYAFFKALSVLPLADGLVISFVAPFITASLAGRFLGERVTAMQWAAIATGFLGVVAVLGPSGRLLEPGALWALLSALTYALNSILLRKIGRTDGATATAFWSTALPCLLYGAAALPGWTSVGWDALPLLVAAGLLGAVGSVAISAAFRNAPAGVLAPLEYTALVWAVVLGFVVFGDVPGPEVVIGSLIIVASGLVLGRARR